MASYLSKIMCVDYSDMQCKGKYHYSPEVKKASQKKGQKSISRSSLKSPHLSSMKKLKNDSMDNSYILSSQIPRIRPPPIHQISQKSEEVIEIVGRDKLALNDHSVLLGFISSTPTIYDTGDLFSSFEQFNLGESSLDKAIAECNNIKYLPNFQEGILLKCFDRNPMFPFVHYNIFKSEPLYEMKTAIDNFMKSPTQNPKSSYGLYEEMFTINKMSTSPRSSLPSHRHSGYIIITFKILDDCSKKNGLEKTWLSWSGAREIYKYSPRTWNLRKISLLKCEQKQANGKKPLFEYVLLCEFGSIFHPSNTIQALDMCERLKTRNCGHISLYQVQYGYDTEPKNTSNYQYNSYNHLNSPPLISSPLKTTTTARKERTPLLRGVSQDVDSTSRSLKYRPKLGTHNLGYSIDEQSRFESYYETDNIE
uniref:CP2 domain-containing protein n=1 Tax=Strongyloides papillosus TaxID=174720 RepID=A0A0N5B8D6_STREA